MREIALRPINDEDIMLLTTWLNKEYILKWYHEPDEWLTEINKRNGTYSWIHHFIVMDKNTLPYPHCNFKVLAQIESKFSEVKLLQKL